MTRAHRSGATGAAFLAVGAAATASLLASSAHAELTDEAARVSTSWTTAGAAVKRAEPHFVSEGDTFGLDLGATAASGCLTVALVGARGLSFHVRTDDAAEDPLAMMAGEPDHGRASSIAGLLTLERCGDAFSHVELLVDGGRGAVETVIARSPRPLPPLRTILPERVGIVGPPGLDLGPFPTLPVLAKRLDAAEARARGDGAKLAGRQAIAAEHDGSGQTELLLAEGCDRVELFAPDLPHLPHDARHGRLDVDAELRDADSDEVLARDRTDAPDAHLELCVGKRTRVTLAFAGAAPDREIPLLFASWKLAEHLPLVWGAEARAGFAAALRARRLPPPPEEPVFLAEGASGATSATTSIEPGACYVATVGTVHGRARGVGLRVRIGGREYQGDRGQSLSATAVAFCAGAEDQAFFDVDARGSGLAWGLAVYRVMSAAWSAR